MPLKACAHRNKGILRIGIAHSDSVRSVALLDYNKSFSNTIGRPTWNLRGRETCARRWLVPVIREPYLVKLPRVLFDTMADARCA